MSDEPGVRCMVMRGGTSKGAYFVADDLPGDDHERDDLLLRIMGSGAPLQIDGIGGNHPLASKVAVVSPSMHPDADVDYLFLQLGVEERTITDRQNCGNILAGVGAFAVERGLVPAGAQTTTVRVRMVNSDSLVSATFATPGGAVRYQGDTRIAGVPSPAAPVRLLFADTAGSATSGLLPTGHIVDLIDGISVTCIDNGMPVVVARATDLGISGYEPYDELVDDEKLRARLLSLQLAAGERMGLGDVTGLSIPKTTLVAPPIDGGTICTRTFIPLKLHASIGVLGAISAMTALLLPGGTGAEFAHLPVSGAPMDVEHLSGHLLVDVDVDTAANPPVVRAAGVVRTARKLFDGLTYPSATYPSATDPSAT